MRIGVDGRVLHGPLTGTGIYARGLLEALANSRQVDSVVVATYAADPRGAAPASELLAHGIHVHELGRLRSPLPGLASRIGLPLPFDVLLPGADWYLFPNFRCFPAWRGSTVTVVHDLAALGHPWSVPPSYRQQVASFTRRAVERSTVVATPSESVADELRTHFPKRAARIVAVRPGIGRNIVREPGAGSRGFQQRYGVLFVGTIQPRKNVDTLLSGYGRLPDDMRRAHPLRLVGQAGWEEPRLFERLRRMEDEVTLTGYVTEEALREAYDTAAVVVAPSWYEGFDLPVLEAMAAGVPAVCSDIAVHREVAGPAGRYFAANDASELERQLVSLLTDGRAWEQASQESRRRSREFSWRASADVLLAELEC